MKHLTPGASDTTKSSAFCVCCVVFVISFLQEQSDLAPHSLQIYANNFLQIYAADVWAEVFSDALGFRTLCI